jgi:hypothetical protein
MVVKEYKISKERYKTWMQAGKAHRENDQPALSSPDGSKFWLINGKLHRDSGQPASIYADGSKVWWENGIRIKRLSATVVNKV